MARERKEAGDLPDYGVWAKECQVRKSTLQRRTHFENVPIKPQRVYEEMNKAFDENTRYVSTIGLSQIAGAQFLHVFKPRNWINCGQAGPLGWTLPAALGVATADPDATVVALSGDYDFQFMIEELAVGAQFQLPYIHVVVNNAYLGLIRQSQRGFEMDFQVQLSFENINSPELGGYGVDHVKVAEGLGCKAIRVFEPDQIAPALEKAKAMMHEFRVPVSSRSSWSGSPTSPWAAPTSPTSWSSRNWPSAARTPPPRSRCWTEPDPMTSSQSLATLRRTPPMRAHDPPVTGGHVLIASDKFKGSLTAAEVGAAVGAGLRSGGARPRRRWWSRWPTAATARWPPRSRPATAGCRCTAAGPTGAAGRPPATPGRTTWPWSNWPTSPGCRGCPAGGSRR